MERKFFHAWPSCATVKQGPFQPGAAHQGRSDPACRFRLEPKTDFLMCAKQMPGRRVCALISSSKLNKGACLACEEVGILLPSDSKHDIAVVWVAGARCVSRAKWEREHTWLCPPQQDDRAVQEDGRAVQEGWSTLMEAEISSPQSRLNSGAFCKRPLEPPADKRRGE